MYILDCGPLDSPCGASVSMLGTTVGSVATYSCDPGFSLVGDETRTCQSYGYWSGSVPCCENKCSRKWHGDTFIFLYLNNTLVIIIIRARIHQMRDRIAK